MLMLHCLRLPLGDLHKLSSWFRFYLYDNEIIMSLPTFALHISPDISS